MSRAERRKAASVRRRAAKAILGFHHATQASHGAVETYIVSIADYLDMLVTEGNATAETLTGVIQWWSREAVEREADPRAQFLCLDCPVAFGPNNNMPAAFAITLPFSDRRRAIVTGICETCADKGEDLQHMALRRLSLADLRAAALARRQEAMS